MIVSWLKTSGLSALLLIVLFFSAENSNAQSVPFPEDPPPYNNMSYWGYEEIGQGWDTSPYIPFIYQGTWFRLLPPNGVTYDPNTDTWTNTTGQDFPLMIYSMGAGGRGTDNTVQLKGRNDIGQRFMEDVQSGEFPAFVLFWQTENQELASSKFASLVQMALNYLDVDENRVYISGRSRGATQTWQHLRDRPDLIAASLSISGASGSFFNSNSIHVPVRHVQGGRDNNPTPDQSQDLVEQYVQNGGDLEYFYYEDLGHSAWARMYNRSDFYTWFLEQKKNQPLVFYGFTEVCPGDDVNITLGYTAGFSGYEWMKDGVVISGASGNEYTVTEFGTYKGRFRRGANWTDWSDPIEISVKNPTITPDIETNGFVSKVLPSLDGNTVIGLELPEGYADYQWKKSGSSTIIGNERILQNVGPGDYEAQVQEFGGCASSFGNPFTIVDANGANGPDAPLNLIVNTLGKTELELVWEQNLAPLNNETGFEIYRSLSENGELELLHITGADQSSYVDGNLDPNTSYWYQMRAINSYGGSTATALVSGSTELDEKAPEAPTNLKIISVTSSAVEIDWDEAVDNVGVDQYEILINGVKNFVTDESNFLVSGLLDGQTYQISVKATDVAGNISPESQILYVNIGATANANFKFNNNFDEANNLNVVASGNNGVGFDDNNLQEGSHVLSLDGINDYVTLSGGDDLFVDEFAERSVAFWAFANSVNGNQVLYDEGGSTNGFAVRINNGLLEFAVRDGSTQNTISSLILPSIWIHITAVFDGGDMLLYQNGELVASDLDVGYTSISRHTDASGFGATGGGSNAFNEVGGVYGGYLDDLHVYSNAIDESGIEQILTEIENPIPLAPTEVVAIASSYNQVEITWVDNSTIETGFQVLRSTSFDGPWNAIAKLPADVNEYVDKGLSASTTYYYSVIALGEFGSAEFVSDYVSLAQAQLNFNDDLGDASGNGTSSALRNGATFSFANKYEGSHALDLSGNNDYVDFDTGNSFIHDEFSERTFALWVYTDNVNGIQDLFDEGGSTNGFGLRINNGLLEAAVQDAHDIQMVSGQMTASEWTHVAVVFNSGALYLYINGILAESKLDIPYSTVSSHGNDAGIGASNSSNAFDVVNNNFNGFIDDFNYFLSALDESGIENVMNGAGIPHSARTFDLPQIPTPPANLAIDNVSASSVVLNWDDYGSSETAYEVYRSSNGPDNLVLVETLGPDQTTYSFDNLLAHTEYLFEVLTINVSGSSSPSSVVVNTLNTTPSMPAISDVLMRYDEIFELALQAVDPDGSNEQLALNAVNFPPFANVYDYGDGFGEMIIEPNLGDEGFYPDLVIQVSDNFGGMLELTFDLTVNSNHTPVITGASNVNIRESDTAVVTLTGSDSDGDDLTWVVNNPPSMLSTEVDGDDLVMTFGPGLLDAGSYSIQVTLNDGNDGQSLVTIDAVIEDFDPNYEVYVNFGGSGVNAAAPWNNITGDASQGTAGNDLSNNYGDITSIGVALETAFNGSSTSGGKSPGIYPDDVMLSYFWTSDVSEDIRISGLNPDYIYNFEMLGSRNSNGDRTTVFTVGGQSASVNATQNTSNTARLEGLVPDVNGDILMTVSLGSGASYGYLNSMIIESRFDDGSAPASPGNLTASLTPTNGVLLEWTDIAFNEQGYKVYRSSLGEAEQEIGTVGVDVTEYEDISVLGHTTYSYRVSAYSGNGESSTPSIEISTNNNIPEFELELEQTVLVDIQTNMDVVVTDFDGDRVEVSFVNLPPFGSYISEGNGIGSLSLMPSFLDIGSYTVQVVLSDYDDLDNLLSTTPVDLVLTVTDRVEDVILINFSVEGVAGSPWNNTNTFPSSGKSFTNLSTTEGLTTTVDVELLDGWSGGNSQGINTGNNSGMYPDIVMSTYYAHNSSSTKRILFTDLDPSKLYDFVFFASRAGITEDRFTEYTIGSKTVTLNARNNASEVVRINAVSPDGNGEILLGVTRAAGSSWGYINTLELHYYEPSAVPGEPLNLSAKPSSKSSIALNWSDNSNNETGFEIYRSQNEAGPFSLVTTVGVDVESYEDGGLTTAQTYYYMMRAVNGEGQSPYTSVVGSSTLRNSIYINVGGEGAVAGSPWNNTNNRPFIGNVYPNLLTDDGSPSGVDMEIASNSMGTSFATSGNGGATTGDDSGVFPDVVMGSYYYIEQIEIATFKFSNLNLTRQYDFEFFASRTVDKRGTDFTINGETVTLDAYNNTNNTVRIDGVQADENGEIFLDMNSMEGATLAHVGAIVIYVSDVVGGASNARQSSGISDQLSLESNDALIPEFKVYPNPFDSQIKIRTNDKIGQVYLVDNVGRVIKSPNLISSDFNE
ncbi:fibronectin type III domain-containing protein, partial [Fulvivirga lutimaris]|uniref:fibronectin type III domain-containing protein n=1 Tax=Fulvivirga lutimaris TaxID=1819566 RepID=UPI0012BBBE5F